MAEWKPWIFVSGAIGWSGLRLREMEKFYEKNVKEQAIRQYQPAASALLSYENELSQEEKDNILKDIYSCVKLFYTIVCKEQRKSSLTQ